MKRLHMALCGMIIALALIMMPSVVAGAAEQVEDNLLSANDGQINNDDTLSVVEVNYSTKEEQYFNLSLNRLKDENRSKINENNLDTTTIDEAFIPDGMLTTDSIQPNALLPGKTWAPVSNVNAYPYSAVLAMRMGWENASGVIEWYYGTGFLEGYDVVATAGHNMWDGQLGWVDDCRFYVRQNGSSYSSTSYYHPQKWTCATNYTSNLDTNYDWCAITLWDNLGSSNGWFGKGWSSGNINGKSVTLSGYPGTAGIQYTGSGTTSHSTTHKVRYDINTLPGNSGSPVYTSDYIVWAIHTTSYSSSHNMGNRITEWLYTILQNKFLEGAAIYGS